MANTVGFCNPFKQILATTFVAATTTYYSYVQGNNSEKECVRALDRIKTLQPRMQTAIQQCAQENTSVVFQAQNWSGKATPEDLKVFCDEYYKEYPTKGALPDSPYHSHRSKYTYELKPNQKFKTELRHAMQTYKDELSLADQNCYDTEFYGTTQFCLTLTTVLCLGALGIAYLNKPVATKQEKSKTDDPLKETVADKTE